MSSAVKIYYRISDQSYEKPKLPGASKTVCLYNCLKAFPNDPIRVIADRCRPETVEWIKHFGMPCHETDLGNAGSMKYALQLAKDNRDDTICYFVEDDYLHREGADVVLREGFTVAEYVTLYDHPDKYTRQYRNGEISQVRRTPHSHWRYTLSTCMTFAMRAEFLRHDWAILDRYTDGQHPNDHQLFCDLNGSMRRVGVAIPGYACHTDLTFSGAAGRMLIEEWAIELMNRQLDQDIDNFQDEQLSAIKARVIDKMPAGWDKLKMQDSLLKAMKLH